LLVAAAEGLGMIPRGTHHWEQFLTPDQLSALLANAGLTVTDTIGIGFDPARGFQLSDNLALNYILCATKK
jgi:2-polyprenyl-6-hydroxyphenyl methylase/3-demethylubiquinone-9 3-methyltransferase